VTKNNKNITEEIYLTESFEKIDSQNNNLGLADINLKQQTPVSVMNLKVGDKLGDFQIKEINPLNASLPFSSENFSIILNGETTITGEFALSDYYGTYFITPDSNEKLPQIIEKPNYDIHFPKNESFFPKDVNRGKIKITFKGLTLESASEPYYFDGSKNIIKSEIIKNN